MILNLERAARDYKEFRAELAKHDISIVIGGQVFKDERLRNRFLSNFYAENFSQLLTFANKICGNKN